MYNFSKFEWLIRDIRKENRFDPRMLQHWENVMQNQYSYPTLKVNEVFLALDKLYNERHPPPILPGSAIIHTSLPPPPSPAPSMLQHPPPARSFARMSTSRLPPGAYTKKPSRNIMDGIDEGPILQTKAADSYKQRSRPQMATVTIDSNYTKPEELYRQQELENKKKSNFVPKLDSLTSNAKNLSLDEEIAQIGASFDLPKKETVPASTPASRQAELKVDEPFKKKISIQEHYMRQKLPQYNIEDEQNKREFVTGERKKTFDFGVRNELDYDYAHSTIPHNAHVSISPERKQLHENNSPIERQSTSTSKVQNSRPLIEKDKEARYDERHSTIQHVPNVSSSSQKKQLNEDYTHIKRPSTSGSKVQNSRQLIEKDKEARYDDRHSTIQHIPHVTNPSEKNQLNEDYSRIELPSTSDSKAQNSRQLIEKDKDARYDDRHSTNQHIPHVSSSSIRKKLNEEYSRIERPTKSGSKEQNSRPLIEPKDTEKKKKGEKTNREDKKVENKNKAGKKSKMKKKDSLISQIHKSAAEYFSQFKKTSSNHSSNQSHVNNSISPPPPSANDENENSSHSLVSTEEGSSLEPQSENSNMSVGGSIDPNQDATSTSPAQTPISTSASGSTSVSNSEATIIPTNVPPEENKPQEKPSKGSRKKGTRMSRELANLLEGEAEFRKMTNRKNQQKGPVREIQNELNNVSNKALEEEEPAREIPNIILTPSKNQKPRTKIKKPKRTVEEREVIIPPPPREPIVDVQIKAENEDPPVIPAAIPTPLPTIDHNYHATRMSPIPNEMDTDSSVTIQNIPVEEDLSINAPSGSVESHQVAFNSTVRNNQLLKEELNLDLEESQADTAADQQLNENSTNSVQGSVLQSKSSANDVAGGYGEVNSGYDMDASEEFTDVHEAQPEVEDVEIKYDSDASVDFEAENHQPISSLPLTNSSIKRELVDDLDYDSNDSTSTVILPSKRIRLESRAPSSDLSVPLSNEITVPPIVIKQEPFSEDTPPPIVSNDESSSQDNLPVDVNKVKMEKIAVDESTLVANIKRVSNIGWVSLPVTFEFCCLLGSCDFKSPDRSEFQAHLFNSHNNIVWDGYCFACEATITESFENSLEREFRHLVDVHVRHQEIVDLEPQIEQPKGHIRLISIARNF